MPESFVRLPADSTGKRLRTSQRNIGGVDVETQYVLPVTDRVVANSIAVSTFRTVGAAATAQTLFTLENQAGSGVIVAVRRLAAYEDTTAALTAVVPTLRTSRTTAMPTGGTVIAKGMFDTAPPASPAGVVARGATASDGGAATVITATASGSPVWESMGQRMHTLVGQVLTDAIPCLPELVSTSPFLLREGEALMVAVGAAAATANPATNHYIINAFFEEVSYP